MVCRWPPRDPVYTLWRLLAQRRQGQKICLARHPRISALGRAKPAAATHPPLLCYTQGTMSPKPLAQPTAALLRQGLRTLAWEGPFDLLFCLISTVASQALLWHLKQPAASPFFSL